MSLNSGTRSLFGEVASWVFMALMLVVAVVHEKELRALVGSALGLPSEAEIAAMEEAAAEARATNPEPEVTSSGAVEIRASDNGHYHTAAEVNGREVEFMVDTGATMVALTYEDAEAAGLYLKHSDFTAAVSTANGMARVAPVMLGSVSIGDITVRNVKAAVSEPGMLKTSLLGMSFLSRLERFDMRQGVLILED